MMMMMRSVVVLSVCVLVSTLFVSTGITAELMCIQGGVVPDCNDVSLGLEAIWDSSSCRFVCPTKCPNGDAFRNCQTSGCSTMRCMAGTTCRNDRCVKGKNQCVGTCVPNPTSPPPPPTVAPTQCAFGTTIQELRSNADFEISKPKVVHTVSSAASLLPSSQAQLLGGVDGFSTLTDLFSFVEDGKIYQENVWYKPTSEMYVLYTYSAGENNHGWINPASESYRAVRIGDESMYECRVQKDEPVCASCAAMLCLTGTTCIENNGCGTCEAIQTTKAPTLTCGERGLGCSVLDCRSGQTCVEDPSTCDATCQVSDPVSCIQMCKTQTCPGYDEPQMVCDIQVINNVCTWVCPAPPSSGTVVRTLSFTLRWRDAHEAKLINTAMHTIAKKSGVEKNFVINNRNIQILPKNYYHQNGERDWSIKVGFKGETVADREKAKDKFEKKLKKDYDAWGFISEETLTTAETMSMQTCGDGNEMSVEQQCPIIDDLIVPTATSSSSSTPIAAIIAPIVAGIVLVAAIATAIIIIRRRRINTIKTMDRMETQMTNNPAITTQV